MDGAAGHEEETHPDEADAVGEDSGGQQDAEAEAGKGCDLVAESNLDFFREADEVDELLAVAVRPDLEPAKCEETCARICAIWGQYQEQPGLLDPFLEGMVTPLINAMGGAIRQNPLRPVSELANLHQISGLLYKLTCVRGYKKVSRLFPHEAADLEPCVAAAEEESRGLAEQMKQRDPDSDLPVKETWYTLYCLTLWLGMVLLTPFDLKSIDSGSEKTLSQRIFELGQEGLRSTSRTRDASSWMLAKFFMRPDVALAGPLQSFVQWTREAWAEPWNNEEGGAAVAPPASLAGVMFARCGAMQAWNQTFKVAPRSVLKTVWSQVLELVLQGPAVRGDKDFGASAVLRKLRIALACRAGMAALPPRVAAWRYERGARSLLVNFAAAGVKGTGIAEHLQASDAQAGFQPPPRAAGADAPDGEGDAEEEDDEDVPEQVEEVIELLLSHLSDADTVVRWAAAKGIGRITNRLSRDFGDQVLESILERCFTFRETDKAWHGGCLALAELSRRGLLLPDRLETVVPLVCQALHFEQVSGQYAVGQHVRDAACYVCWAFARAYAPDVLEPFVADIACALLQIAVYDREINCRRAAAAAVQEHVGRQGTFPNGIDVVTIADYWTLSSRRNAYLGVARELAELGTGSYWQPLMDHLVNRQLAHQDLQIRLLTSQALARLTDSAPDAIVAHLNDDVLPKLVARALASDGASGGSFAVGGAVNVGTVQARHGAVAGVAALTEALQGRVAPANQTAIRNLVPGLEKIRAYRGRGGEVIRQAACNLLKAVAAASSWPFKDATSVRYLQTIDECARHATTSIQVAAADALAVLASVRMPVEACDKSIEASLLGLTKGDIPVSARRGWALCLGAMPSKALGPERLTEVLAALCKEVRGVYGAGLPGGEDQDDPQTRQYAVLSLGKLCMKAGVKGSDLDMVLDALRAAMRDYATDRRGDVGSWVREAAMEVIAALLEAQQSAPVLPGRDVTTESAPMLPGRDVTTELVALLMQQAVEKIDRLRARAFGLLRRLFVGCGPVDPAHFVELAYRRVCHSEPYEPFRYEASAPSRAKVSSGGAAWPPAEADAIMRLMGECQVAGPLATHIPENAETSVEYSAAIFEAVVPLLRYPPYRAPVTRGLVISLGGLTEHIAKDAKRALQKYLKEDPEGLCGGFAAALGHQVLETFVEAGTKDTEPEAKRVLAPLLTSCGILLAQGCWPERLAKPLWEAAFATVRSSKDIHRLRASIAVFVGLLRWTGSVRRKSLAVVLQFLGYSFPTVRQAAARALYIRLLSEEADLDLTVPEEGIVENATIPGDTVAEVLEIISISSWGTDNEDALAAVLREVYVKLGVDLPTGGRSILAPQRPKKEAAKPEGLKYADLVNAEHF